ncbi:hypothetical protein TNIN_410381, partial [Trichonephila inaurata madagascariensis]
LNLEITEDGTVKSTDVPRKIINAGESEPNKSVWDRAFLAEEERIKVLKRDLKKLDEWLEVISRPDMKVLYSPTKLPEESKKDELRFRERTNKRLAYMDIARKRLISIYEDANPADLSSVTSDEMELAKNIFDERKEFDTTEMDEKYGKPKDAPDVDDEVVDSKTDSDDDKERGRPFFKDQEKV